MKDREKSVQAAAMKKQWQNGKEAKKSVGAVAMASGRSGGV